jgi:hypothetical protein
MLPTVSPMTCLDTRPTSDGMCFSDDDVCPLALCFLAFLSFLGSVSGNSPEASSLTPILMEWRFGKKRR